MLVLDAASWVHESTPDGLELVVVDHTSSVELIQENLTVNEQGFDPEATPVDAAAAEAFRSSLRGCAAVTARWQGRPVAAGMFTPVDDGRSELVGITTLASHRRRGFGAAVASRLVEEALEAGATSVFLTTDDDAALRLYRRMGFRER